MDSILVIVERAGEGIDDSTWEMAALARESCLGSGRVVAALLGSGVAGLADELTPWFDEVLVADDPRLDGPDGVAYADVLRDVLTSMGPTLTLAAHTNVGMDLAPRLAVVAGVPLVADCLELQATADSLTAVRTMFGGKVHARVKVLPSAAGAMATLRPGAGAASPPPGVGGVIRALEMPAEVGAGRRHVATVRPEPGAVDISQAELLVAVGRGIEEEENLDMVRSLAKALGAELACTRPIVDKGWLPKTYQVGTSGVTVKPAVYVTVGISGSFQHMGGVKGSPYIVAINSDPAAPIFATADVGVVGDLFDIVPLLADRIREAKG